MGIFQGISTLISTRKVIKKCPSYHFYIESIIKIILLQSTSVEI